jgi:ribosomal protein S18 acetylase RimI-like enzyme
MIRAPDEIEIMCRYEIYVGNDLAGFAQISNNPEDGQPLDTRYVTILKVDPKYRRRGLATRLYQAIEEHLALRGLHLVESQHQTDEAKAFWRAYKTRPK